MIVQGSIGYTYSGRRRVVSKSKKVQPVFKPMDKPLFAKREEKKYPSAPLTEYTPRPRDDWRREESKNHTVAIAYNKGGYMVISKDNIRDIGR